MKLDLELTGSTLIEVDPYCCSQSPSTGKPGGENISAIDFGAGQGSSGVDLRWHHPKDFKALSNEHKDELCAWQKTTKGKNILDKSRAGAAKKRNHGEQDGGGDKKSIGQGAWKKKLKHAVKTHMASKPSCLLLQLRNQGIKLT